MKFKFVLIACFIFPGNITFAPAQTGLRKKIIYPVSSKDTIGLPANALYIVGDSIGGNKAAAFRKLKLKDIESIEIQSERVALSYGKQGKNGVIFIRTRYIKK